MEIMFVYKMLSHWYTVGNSIGSFYQSNSRDLIRVIDPINNKKVGTETKKLFFSPGFRGKLSYMGGNLVG